jgi:hypothetical protein
MPALALIHEAIPAPSGVFATLFVFRGRCRILRRFPASFLRSSLQIGVSGW